MMTEKRLCKKCGVEKDLQYFYKRRNNKHCIEKATGSCKHCLGIKNPDKITFNKTIEVKPTKKELSAFVHEMEIKLGHFDFVDSLRLINIFTQQYGLVFTSFSIEEELMYMWEKLKNEIRKK